jgi:hypothetical protein
LDLSNWKKYSTTFKIDYNKSCQLRPTKSRNSSVLTLKHIKNRCGKWAAKISEFQPVEDKTVENEEDENNEVDKNEEESEMGRRITILI